MLRTLLPFAALTLGACQEPPPPAATTPPPAITVRPASSVPSPVSAPSETASSPPSSTVSAPVPSSSTSSSAPAPSASAQPVAEVPEQFRDLPKEYSGGVALLLYLASLNEDWGIFDPQKSKPADVPRITAALAPEVEFADVNSPGKGVRFSREQIAEQLQQRQGTAFVRLMNVGASVFPMLKYPRPTHVRAYDEPNGFTIELTTLYRLTFRATENEAQLEAVRYLHFNEH
jgi:hypothetical protein